MKRGLRAKCGFYEDAIDEQDKVFEVVEEIIGELTMQGVMPNSLFACDISENMDLQAVRVKIAQEWSDQIYWAIRGMYDGKNG